jgi:Protein of unknown function (DUF2510)
MLWWLDDATLRTDIGNDAVGDASISIIVNSLCLLGAALMALETVLLLRWHALRTEKAPSSSLIRPPGWYVDPWGQVTSRWWDGAHWTGRLKADPWFTGPDPPAVSDDGVANLVDRPRPLAGSRGVRRAGQVAGGAP